MSAQVNLLAVMDRGIELLMSGHATLWTARDVLTLRAAVADLVEAAATVEKLATLHDGDDYMFDRLHAALAPFMERA